MLLAAGALTFTAATPADAHRDGCHRWHSCPSDSGSYICGDLGYDSGCPGTTETTEPDQSEDETVEPDLFEDTSGLDLYEDLDLEAPSVSRVSKPVTGPGGKVAFSLVTERGARIAVIEDEKTVLRTTGTGTKQTISFKAKSGTHTYVVTSTDAAGNTSEPSSPVTVVADATNPPIRNVKAPSPTAQAGAAMFSFTTEIGAKYTLKVRGQKTINSTATSSAVSHAFWLANGTYPATLTVTDPTGNASSIKRTLKVSITRPVLTLSRVTAPNAPITTYDVTATPRSRGNLTFPGHRPIAFTVPDNGKTSITAALPDGVYREGTAALTDFAGRQTSVALPAFTLDTAAPALAAAIDTHLAQQGLVKMLIRTERGARLTITATPADQVTEAAPVTQAITAAASEVTWQPQLPAGAYTISVAASDRYNNTSTTTKPLLVEDPWTAPQIAALVAALAVILLLLAFAATLLWRGRHRIAAWRQRRSAMAAQRSAQRAAALARLEYESALAQHRVALAAHARADAVWRDRRKHLSDQAQLARGLAPTQPAGFGLVRLKPHEGVYATVPATLIEERSRQGHLTLVPVEDGQLVLTTTRLLFVGTKNREWRFANVTGVRISADDAVMMTVTNRKTASGVRARAHGQAWERDHLSILIALTEAAGERDQLIQTTLDELAQHDAARPFEPQAPRSPQPLQPTAVG